MRMLALAALFALLPQAIPQDKPAEEMKHLLLPGRSATVGGATLSAFSIERGVGYPSVIKARGKVEIRNRVMILTADEVDYHEDTGEMEPRGHVRVKMADFTAK